MKKILMFGVVLVLLAGGVVSSSSAAEAEIVLVGHERIEEPLTQEEIQQIFLGKKTRWKDNSTIIFVIFNQEDAYKTFLKQYVQKTYSQYLNYWKKQVFTGKGRMPKMFNDPQELMAFLANTEGAISFARAQDVTTSNMVKVIPVIP
ncbi:hypothetical protein U27_03502 [Candidatus Vecturithrix granuli]|uniref:PBP domain-containing protein n=1 Tax=Vecturithrix granuli TaxID=1499967 RepID=A0A081BW35_VECG1|nr:hypothetical protein U27_03502 [Candidatus Vecturithrix granuli]